MKLLLLLILVTPLFTIGQDSIVPVVKVDSVDFEIIDFPEVEASFPGGVGELMKFIMENFSYSEHLIDPELESRIFLFFVIDSEGNVLNGEVEQVQSPEIAKMGLELIAKMPNWIPAKYLGENVASYVRLPIVICLE
ncbi:MAG: protein TonB [Crocinitomicaceae bacterium]|jgi:protein TonB